MPTGSTRKWSAAVEVAPKKSAVRSAQCKVGAKSLNLGAMIGPAVVS